MQNDVMKLLQKIEELSSTWDDISLEYAKVAKRSKQILAQYKEDQTKESEDNILNDTFSPFGDAEITREHISQRYEKKTQPFLKAVQELIEGDIECVQYQETKN